MTRRQTITVELPEGRTLDDVKFVSVILPKGTDPWHAMPIVDVQPPVETPDRYQYNVQIFVDTNPVNAVAESASVRNAIYSRLMSGSVPFVNVERRNLQVVVSEPVKVR